MNYLGFKNSLFLMTALSFFLGASHPVLAGKTPDSENAQKGKGKRRARDLDEDNGGAQPTRTVITTAYRHRQTEEASIYSLDRGVLIKLLAGYGFAMDLRGVCKGLETLLCDPNVPLCLAFDSSDKLDEYLALKPKYPKPYIRFNVTLANFLCDLTALEKLLVAFRGNKCPVMSIYFQSIFTSQILPVVKEHDIKDVTLESYNPRFLTFPELVTLKPVKIENLTFNATFGNLVTSSAALDNSVLNTVENLTFEDVVKFNNHFRQLGYFTNLRELWLPECNVSEESLLATVQLLPKLTKLFAPESAPSDNLAKYLATHRKGMKMLAMNVTSIEGVKEISSLKELYNLTLYKGLSNESANYIGLMPSLKYLCLEDFTFSSNTYPHFAGLPNLIEVFVNFEDEKLTDQLYELAKLRVKEEEDEEEEEQ